MKIYRDSLPSPQVVVRLAGSSGSADFYLNSIEKLVISDLSLTVTTSSIELHWKCSHEDNTYYVVLDKSTSKSYTVEDNHLLFSGLTIGQQKSFEIQAFNDLYDPSDVKSIDGQAVEDGIGAMKVGSTFIVGGDN